MHVSLWKNTQCPLALNLHCLANAVRRFPKPSHWESKTSPHPNRSQLNNGEKIRIENLIGVRMHHLHLKPLPTLPPTSVGIF